MGEYSPFRGVTGELSGRAQKLQAAAEAGVEAALSADAELEKTAFVRTAPQNTSCLGQTGSILPQKVLEGRDAELEWRRL